MNVSEFNQSDEIISILKSEIENFDEISKDSEVGTVVTVGDGIATIYGIDHAMYGEDRYLRKWSEGYGTGYPERRDRMYLIWNQNTGIKEGTKVARTKKKDRNPGRR